MENKPCINNTLELEAAYQQMSQDYVREMEALKLAEAMVGDVGDEKN